MAVATTLTARIYKAFPSPSGEPTYEETTDIYMDPDVPGMEVLYRVAGRLTSAGVGVSGKTITVTYDAGTPFGSDTTDGDGYYEVEAGIQEAPDPQKMFTANFAGDGGFLTSDGYRIFALKLIPTTLSGVNIPGQFPQNQYYVVKGTVTVNWADWYYNGSPVEGMDVDLVVNAVVEQTVATDSEGKFKLYEVFPDEIWKIIQVQTNDTAVYEGEITPYVSMHIVNHWYPQPEDVETDCYAWLLCVDPNSIRGGPMYYVLDDATVKPGLTDKTGTFAGQLNDNYKVRPALPAGSGAQDFTAYTEVDTGNKINVVNSNRVIFSFADYKTTEQHKLYKTMPLGIEDYAIEITINVSDMMSSASVNIRGALMVFSDSQVIDDPVNLDNSGDFTALMIIGRTTTTDWALQYRTRNGGVIEPSVETGWLDVDTDYYLSINRNGKHLSCYVYSDEARTNLVDSTALTMTNDVTFGAPGETFYAFSNWGMAPPAVWTGLSLKNFTMTEPEDAEFIQYAMYLLGEDKEFILDQDEFWIGLQRGVASKRYDPENYAWDYQGGTDNKGSGVHWLMGGYITKRYYTRAAKKRVTAIFIGKCYMDVWKDQLFGTDEIPRDYEYPTSLDVIANDVFSDVNAQQEDDYKFTFHPTYWQSGITTLTVNASYGSTLISVVDVSNFNIGDIIKISDANGSEDLRITGKVDTVYLQNLDVEAWPTQPPTNPGIQSLLGYDKATATVSPRSGLMSETWQKQFTDDNPFSIMQSICETAVYEFRINYLKQAMLYPKDDPPLPTNRDIRYTTNIRSVPEIVMGDTENIITNVIVRDGLPSTRPESLVTWTADALSWYDILTNDTLGYDAAGPPAPPNPVTGSYVDTSLIWDDESYPALCFQQRNLNGQVSLHLGYYVDAASGEVKTAQMQLDLRTHRRFKFKWRHVTWNGVLPDSRLITDPVDLTGLEYEIRLWTRWEPLSSGYDQHYFFFKFGGGYQESLGFSSNDRIWSSPIPDVPVPLDSGWKLIDLLLPEPDNYGDITTNNPDQMKGWEAQGDPDADEINWISFSVTLPEPRPNGELDSSGDPITDPSGYATPTGKEIKQSEAVGAFYIRVDNPENLMGLSNGWSGGGEAVLKRGLDGEIDGEYINPVVIHPKSAPGGGQNIRLAAPLLNTITYDPPPGTNSDYLRILSGRTFCFSQVRFERDFKSTGEGTGALGPKRYRIYSQDELTFQSEADSKVEEILNMEGKARRWVKIVIDGDPEKEVGTNVRVFLDPTYLHVFQAASMMVDDIEYKLNSVNLEQTLTLTPVTLSAKAREINEYNISDTTNLSLGKTSSRGRRPFKEKEGGFHIN